MRLRCSPERGSTATGSGKGAHRGGGAVKAGVGVDVEGRDIDRNLMVVAAGQKVAEGILLSVRHRRGGRS
jgi:hypothetical protein